MPPNTERHEEAVEAAWERFVSKRTLMDVRGAEIAFKAGYLAAYNTTLGAEGERLREETGEDR